ncbi:MULTISPECIES: single-stranded DNA-binding protein [unclassified Microcella]|uniref:single-stranded DNA-binding protein n=1 Tax=unclassified Microcella TaxID=2630066 RepID=UPI0006FC8C40|nr:MULTISPECIES: single-stranded DNA-binding protein [unclassified Microcella]KQV24660.1 single-stranded DNA-binding protein [Yonghaparkia sp. Root332]KRF30950.1 single-stranded DNA-binding protein [Yonghaparkia sp. Soil809]
MTDTITLTGLVATTPRHIVTSEGLAITSFRLASNQRRFDRAQNAWVDGDTNWYTITSFRQLGAHVASSVHKGERVIVSGRVRIRDWTSGERNGTTIEIDAEAVGHDLTWGRSSFTRSVIVGRGRDDAATDAPPEQPEPVEVPDDASSLEPREPADAPF